MTRRQFAFSLSAAAASTPLSNAAGSGEFFYRPAGAWAADFIPFFHDGRFRLFYLLDWRDREKHGEGTPWYQISTSDFVQFTEHGEMLPRGGSGEQDLYVFTGSAIQAAGRFHIFYTGHNPYFRKQDRPEQGIMHAVSDDLLHWRKIPAHTFFAPAAGYEPHDWRDPFVFHNDASGEYWMLAAARLRKGPSRRRGCTALCVSRDLEKWEVREPFWAPGLYFTHECPDLFRMGEWWYLVFSEFSDGLVTRYRMSRTLQGPWLSPAGDTFDGRAFYAAKTASDGRRRYLFGWNPTRTGARDDGGWNWGGNLVAHEVLQERDGSLSVRVPETVDRAFGRAAPVRFSSALGESRSGGGSLRVSAPGGFGCATAGALPPRCKLDVSVEFERNTRACGLMLRSSQDLEQAYYIRLEPGRNRLVFDSWPRRGDLPFAPELERPVALEPGRPVDLKVFVDGSVCVAYAAGRIAMNTRLYNLPEGDWGVFVQEGSARFHNARLSILA